MKRLSLLIIVVLVHHLLGIIPAVAQETEVIEVIDIMKLYERAAMAKRGEKILVVGFTHSYDGINTFIYEWWGERRASSWYITSGLRYGLLRDIELNFDVPFVFSEETETTGVWSQRKSGKGLGDIDFGIRYEVLHDSRPLWGRFLAPSVILGVSYKLDSGKSPYGALGADELPVGSGHKNVGLESIISRVVDPVLIYASGGYIVTLRRKHDNIEYDPGNVFNWGLGMGFSVNPWVSIGGGVEGLVIGGSEIDGEKVVGSDQTLIHTSFNLAYTISKDLRFTVTTTTGINENASDFALNSAISYTF